MGYYIWQIKLLKLVKDRSSKDIDTNQNEEETKKLETRTSLDDNTDDDEDKDPTTDKEESVCVKKMTFILAQMGEICKKKGVLRVFWLSLRTTSQCESWKVVQLCTSGSCVTELMLKIGCT